MLKIFQNHFTSHSQLSSDTNVSTNEVGGFEFTIMFVIKFSSLFFTYNTDMPYRVGHAIYILNSQTLKQLYSIILEFLSIFDFFLSSLVTALREAGFPD